MKGQVQHVAIAVSVVSFPMTSCRQGTLSLLPFSLRKGHLVCQTFLPGH